MPKIPINRVYDPVAAVDEEQAYAEERHRNLQCAISERTMTRSDYYALTHYLRNFYWHVRKLAGC